MYKHSDLVSMLVHNDFRYQITLVRGFSMYFICFLLLSTLLSCVFGPQFSSCLI